MALSEPPPTTAFNPILIKYISTMRSEGPVINGTKMHHLHRIFSALRGPDLPINLPFYDDFKKHYTIPIRCWVYNQTPEYLYNLGMPLGFAPPVCIEDWRKLLKALKSDMIKAFQQLIDKNELCFYTSFWHYAEHIGSAIDSIILLECANSHPGRNKV